MPKLNDILLNCDLGESIIFPAETNTNSDSYSIDQLVMPFIDMANIACGGHAGDHKSMADAVALAKKHQVLIGAHPSYPDRKHFGRKSISELNITHTELQKTVDEQIDALRQICHEQQTGISYIKPHGALYHDLLIDDDIFTLMLKIAQKHHVPLLLLSHKSSSQLQTKADTFGVTLWLEAFADRAYDDYGKLINRKNPNAVHSSAKKILHQAKGLISLQTVESTNQKTITIPCNSVCVHGDTPSALDALKSIREYMENIN